MLQRFSLLGALRKHWAKSLLFLAALVVGYACYGLCGAGIALFMFLDED